MASIQDLLIEAASATGPTLIEKKTPTVGGVDPLGLRQINFDLMDQVLPGMNNVADKVRPFVLMTWAWRRVRQIVERDKKRGATDEDMRDFVDRIEAIYAWSQFLIDPKAGIPGGQALADLIAGENTSYRFGGSGWVKRRNLRRSSTGLISPLNYGPGLRSMGWLTPVGPPGVFQAHPELSSMLDTFEARFKDILEHEVFNKLGEAVVNRDDVRDWGKEWSLTDLTEDERNAAFLRLAGPEADPKRRDGLALVKTVAVELSKENVAVDKLRSVMAETESDRFLDSAISAKAVAWRAVQTRQLFRLALEGLFHWLIGELIDGPLTSQAIAERFVNAAGNPVAECAKNWFFTDMRNPVDLLEALGEALRETGEPDAPKLIRQAIAYCLSNDDEGRRLSTQASDRLPISRAQCEFQQWQKLSPRQCVVKIVEVWVLAQHAYWCVGRGLADARGRGKTLLRLRIVIDEGGWTLTPGARRGDPPVATPDRLQTALSLLSECGQI